MSSRACLWLKECCGRIEELQGQIQSSVASGKRSVDVPWAWICKELFSLLTRYPTGVTSAIILSELQMLWSSGSPLLRQDGSCRKVEILDFVQARHTNPEGILEGYISSPHDLPGTQIPLTWLRDSAGANSTTSLEMYLHQKFYQHPQLQQNPRVRLTRCRLQQSHALAMAGKSSTKREGARSARLLPTDIMLFIADHETLMMDGFSTQLPSDRSCVGYGSSVLCRVSHIGGTVTVHSPDGGTSQQLCVTLIDDGGSTMHLLLWDEHLQLAQLFKKGDWLGLERPYYQLYTNELFVEYGPASICYCVPFIPIASQGPSNTDSILTHSSVLTDDEGVASVAAYPHRVMVSQVQTGMKAISLCVQVTSKSKLSVCTDGSKMKEFDVSIADESGCATLHIANNQTDMYHHMQPGQCIVVSGLTSTEGEDGAGKRLLWQRWRKGCELWNVTQLAGWLSSPLLCHPRPLAELSSQGCQMCDVIVESVDYVGQQPWCQKHSTCENNVLPHPAGFLHCPVCSCSDLAEEDVRRKGPATKSPDAYWRWSFSIELTLRDTSGSTCQVQPTDDSAQNLLQTTPSLFATLPHQQQCDLLEGLLNCHLVAFLSKCPDSDTSLLSAFIKREEG